jgi:hypothetical protein
MVRLLVHVEGETEETFVNEILCRHLLGCGYESVGARQIGNARQRMRRGGIRPWQTVKTDILRHLKEDTGCVATTMVDYYGLPQLGNGAWPGRHEATGAPTRLKATIAQTALVTDISTAMGGSFDANRFVAFVVMHEFEGLLFSDCEAFARGMGTSELRPRLERIRDQFETPEDINDSPVTAPSKRIKEIMPQYQKPLFGNLAALEIGLNTIRDACPHFANWLSKLESIAKGTG